MNNPGAPSKKDLRVNFAERIAALTPALRSELDTRIQGSVLTLPEFQSARQVLGYIPLPDEPSLIPALAEAIAAGKRVYMPVADPNWVLRYIRWTPADGTRLSAYARWTTASGEEPQVEPSVVLIPGRAFDSKGFRLGRGKGCYDRTMAALRNLGSTIGIAYDVQIISEIPRDVHDEPVDMVVTERQTIRIARAISKDES